MTIRHRCHHRWDCLIAAAATATTTPATAAAAIATIIAITYATDRIEPLSTALLTGLLVVCGSGKRVIICCPANARRGGPRRVTPLVSHIDHASHWPVNDERDVSSVRVDPLTS